MRKATVETGVSLLVCAISVFGLLEALKYSGEAGLMPRGVMALMIFLSTIWFVQSIKTMLQGADDMIAPTPIQLRSALKLVVAGLGLLFGMWFVGFYTSAALIVPLLGYSLGFRNLPGLVIGAVLFLILLMVVFNLLLAVPLPPEAILKLIGQ